jgi:hypothetical protein
MMPLAWAASSASTTSSVSSIAVSTSIGPAAMRSCSDCPSSSSMTMKRRSSHSPMSWIEQMCGWLIDDAARASRT